MPAATQVPLPLDEFEALGQGRGGPAAIASLQRGQLGKNVIQLRMITALVAERHPEHQETTDAAFRLLAAAQACGRRQVDALLTHPTVGSWAARCLRRMHGAGADLAGLAVELGQLAAIAAVAAYRAGHPGEIEIPRHRCVVMLPTLGVARLDGTRSHSPARIRCDGRGLLVECGARSVTVPADPSEDAPGWLGLRRLRSTSAGLTIEVEIDDLDPARSVQGERLSGRLDHGGMDRWQSLLDSAWGVLSRHHPQRAAELSAGVVSLVPLDGEESGTGSSASARGAFGRVMSTFDASGRHFADTLIHEFQHSKLYAVMDMSPLHTAGTEPVHYSPWREDPRPLEGLLQGAYSYLGVVDFWESERHLLVGPERDSAEFEFCRWSRQVAGTVGVLADSGQLTEAGNVLVREMAEHAARWRRPSGWTRPARLAELASEDHRLRWRLRNLRPDPDLVGRLATAWRAGGGCPLDPRQVPVTVRRWEWRAGMGDRLRLIRHQLMNTRQFQDLRRAPERAGDIAGSLGPADVALLLGDARTAARLYEDRIAEAGDDVRPWSGLALALPAAANTAAAALTTTPELVRAIWQRLRRVGGSVVEVEEVASWLGAATGPGSRAAALPPPAANRTHVL